MRLIRVPIPTFEPESSQDVLQFYRTACLNGRTENQREAVTLCDYGRKLVGLVSTDL